LRLPGCSRRRRVLVLRRRLAEGVVAAKADEQWRLACAEIEDDTQICEYAVLVTLLDNGVVMIAQRHRDRGDRETIFDQLKPRWAVLAACLRHGAA
jgi:hypothetical protein